MTDHPHIDPSTDTSDDETLPPSEATDSDELHNDDGDADVTAPDAWRLANARHSLDEKLAAERPEPSAGGGRHRAEP